jgi:hypothetical protein
VATELLKREQSRILSELTSARERMAAVQVKVETIEANLDQALALASNWHQLYVASGPKKREPMNQALFERQYVPGDVIEHDYAGRSRSCWARTSSGQPRSRYLRSADSAAIYREWARLSAKWAAELEADLTSEINEPPPLSRPSSASVEPTVA